MSYDSDTEVIMHFLSREVQAHKPWEELNFIEIFKTLLKDFDGSWNIAFLNEDAKMVAESQGLFKKLLEAPFQRMTGEGGIFANSTVREMYDLVEKDHNATH